MQRLILAIQTHVTTTLRANVPTVADILARVIADTLVTAATAKVNKNTFNSVFLTKRNQAKSPEDV